MLRPGMEASPELRERMNGQAMLGRLAEPRVPRWQVSKISKIGKITCSQATFVHQIVCLNIIMNVYSTAFSWFAAVLMFFNQMKSS